MTAGSTPYAPQIRIVELLEREKAQLTTLPIYRDGALVEPTSGTYTLKTPGGGTHVDAAAVTISGGIAQYSHSAANLTGSLELGEGWVQEWALTIGGDVYNFRRMAALVRRRLYPVISDADLTAVYSDLSALRPSSLTSYQQYIDDAWFTIIRRLRTEGGGLEYLVMSSEAFYESHRHLSLYLIWRDFHSSLGQSNGRYLDLSQEHYRLYQDEWKRISWVYDYGHDGSPDDPDLRQAKTPVIYTSSPGYHGRFRYRRGRY